MAPDRRYARTLMLVGLVALVSACTLEPRYRAPALPVPDQWPIPASTAATAGAVYAPGEPASAAGAATSPGAALPPGVSDVGWRDFFTDVRLQKLIELALANNRDLRVAVLDIEHARDEYHVQRASLLPAVNATGSYTKEKLPAAITGFGVPIQEAYYSATAGISAFELDLFGRVRSLSHSALEQYLSQEQTRRSTQLSLIGEIADAYLTLASDRELQRLAQETLKSQEDSFALTQKRHDAGAASGLDLAQAQTTVESARADLARYQGTVQTDIDALTLLVGTPIDASLLPPDLDSQVVGLKPLPADLPSVVLLRRPDVLSAEYTLRAADASIGAARAAFFPRISLTGDAGFASVPLSGLFKSGAQTWNFAPQVTLPIFAGGQLRGNLAAARTERSIALAQYEKTIQTGFKEVADALALSGTLAREHEAQQALVAATGHAYELSQQRYRAGRDSYLDVLDSQRSYYAAQQGLIAVRLAEQNNRVGLYRSLGGGWLERSQ